jgi:hypothetical protein
MIDPGWFGVMCGLALVWCGYQLGRTETKKEIRAAIEGTVQSLIDGDYIKTRGDELLKYYEE